MLTPARIRLRFGVRKGSAARGVPFRRIPQYDPAAARLAIEEDKTFRMRPVIVADGFCPDCGDPAPLREYLRCVIPYDGYVVLDDTQALGIWGTAPTVEDPYGSGGGGSLRLNAVRSPHVILGSSLAKGFGVPLAVLSGSTRLVQHFERRSETGVHTSPPSTAVLRAAEHVLWINAQYGDEIRLRLAQLVTDFREKIRGTGLRDTGSLFPVQMLTPDRDNDAVRLQQLLLGAGVRTAVVRGPTSPGAKLVFVINASHSTDQIDWATRSLTAMARDLVLRDYFNAFA